MKFPSSSSTGVQQAPQTLFSKSMPPYYIGTTFPKNISVHGIISGPYFPVFGLNIEKYGPEITPYLDILHHAVQDQQNGKLTHVYYHPSPSRLKLKNTSSRISIDPFGVHLSP